MNKCSSKYGSTVVNNIDEILGADNNSGGQYDSGGRWPIKN